MPTLPGELSLTGYYGLKRQDLGIPSERSREGVTDSDMRKSHGRAKRILIFRPDNIGDVILFSGAFPLIRKRYPEAGITVAVKPHIMNLLELSPDIDGLIPSTRLLFWKRHEKSALLRFKLPRRICKNLERISNRLNPAYDALIFPLVSPSTEQLEVIHYLGIRNIAGIAGSGVNEPPEGYPAHLAPERLFSEYLDISRADPWRHEFLATADFLEHLGCNISDISDMKPRIFVSEDDEVFAAAAVPSSEKPVIGISPGASNRIRSWAPENYRIMAEKIGESANFLIFGGAEEIDLADETAATIQKSSANNHVCLNLAGKTTLRQLYCCISRCDLLIGMESAPLHMGIAAGIPTIGIAGGGHHGRFVPWGDESMNIVMTNFMECFHCNWKCKYESPRCIESIDPGKVAEAARRLLGKRKEAKSSGSRRIR